LIDIRRRATPDIARLGFDLGWLCLNLTFLNLRCPVLIIDQRLLPDPGCLGLEPFGTRNPTLPLPDSTLAVQLHPGHMISLWSRSQVGTATLLTWHRPTSAIHPTWAALPATGAVVVIVGNTHHIQLSWAALWDSQIGNAQLKAVGGLRAA
jgi:hypothetical protein